MVTTAIVLFAVAALGGIIMAIMRVGGRELPPMGLAIVHGLFAASGLVALILALVGNGYSIATIIALLGFLGAAVVGFYLFVDAFSCGSVPHKFARARRRSASCGKVSILCTGT